MCYAYLSDVEDGDEDPSGVDSAFRKSKWFTRGCTLQELLAPSLVVLFSRGWVQIGTKSSLSDTIMEITRIEPLDTFREACIAQKMSWASCRETTRVEDIAYCLMGLFGVNMPPLYGEVENAFRRLQLEILNKEDDETIFAWKKGCDSKLVLADSPSAFRSSGDVQRSNYERGRPRPPYSMTRN